MYLTGKQTRHLPCNQYQHSLFFHGLYCATHMLLLHHSVFFFWFFFSRTNAGSLSLLIGHRNIRTSPKADGWRPRTLVALFGAQQTDYAVGSSLQVPVGSNYSRNVCLASQRVVHRTTNNMLVGRPNNRRPSVQKWPFPSFHLQGGIGRIEKVKPHPSPPRASRPWLFVA